LNIDNKTPGYINFLIKKHPQIASGRKNYSKYQKRIFKTIKLIEKYFKEKV
tara:strand:+ start:676 stop:828 length:153 start_codon:yes stop_codon:yes gene_type:complete